MHETVDSRIAHADDHRHAACNPLDEVFRERRRFRLGELVRFAHHAKDSDPAHALGDVELGKRIHARPIDLSLVGKGCYRNNVDTAGVGADLRHDLLARFG